VAEVFVQYELLPNTQVPIATAIYPDAAFGWFIPTDEFYVDGVWQERDGVTGQHGGVLATDTRWLR